MRDTNILKKFTAAAILTIAIVNNPKVSEDLDYEVLVGAEGKGMCS